MSVTPAKLVPDSDQGAGVHNHMKRLDSGVRRNDGPRRFQIYYKTIKFDFYYFIRNPETSIQYQKFIVKLIIHGS